MNFSIKEENKNIQSKRDKNRIPLQSTELIDGIANKNTTLPVAMPGDENQFPRVGIAGGTLSGKTTFLTALPRAIRLLDRYDKEHHYHFDACDQLSIDWLEARTKRLSQGKFPGGTSFSHDLHFLLSADDFFVDILTQEKPGDQYINPSNETIEFLSTCDGIIFLINPQQQEGSNGDTTFTIMDNLLRRIISKISEKRQRVNRSEQKAAVCLTQYDNETFFKWARDRDLLTGREYLGVNNVPFIKDDKLEYIFEEWPAFNINEENIINLFHNRFLPENVTWHAVSSIGFYKPDGQDSIDWDKCYNVKNSPEGNKIRMGGSYFPINIVEPFVRVLGSRND